MKHTIIFLLVVFLSIPIFAQQNRHAKGARSHDEKDIFEVIGDLSANQKRKLENLSEQHKTTITTLKKQLNGVRDSIRMYIEMDNDMTEAIYPLFDREAQIQSTISKERYDMKVKTCEILTKEQQEQLRGCVRKMQHKMSPANEDW